MTGARISSVQLMQITGISYRQLDYWARTGLLVPSIRTANGSGDRRWYSFDDLVLARIIRKLLLAGITLQRIRKMVDYLRETPFSNDAVLLCNDKWLQLVDSPEEAAAIMRNSGRGFVAISPGIIRAGLAAALGKVAA